MQYKGYMYRVPSYWLYVRLVKLHLVILGLYPSPPTQPKILVQTVECTRVNKGAC